MDNYQGDLTDIVRASGGALGQSDVPATSNWEFPSSDPVNFSSTMEDNRDNFFGDPFCNIRDPLLYELNVAGSSYFSSTNSTDMLSTSVDDTTGSFCGSTSSNILAHQKVFEEEMHKSPCNIFSRIQISPNNPNKMSVSPCDSPVMVVASSPRGFKPSAVVSSDVINVNSSKNCLIENTGPVQIGSPRNLGIKRR